jgi:RNA polymerase sigma factor (sigma-70 family)
MERSAFALSSAEEQGDANLLHYQKTIRHFFFRRVPAQWDVEDLVQESVARFIVASRRDSLQQPLGYLFRIARNLLIDHARRDAVAVPVTNAPEEELQVAVRAEQEDALHLADLQSALDAALDELPLKCREAFILRRFHAMDTPAIAERLNVSHRMVQKYLIRAMEHLRQRLTTREESL